MIVGSPRGCDVAAAVSAAASVLVLVADARRKPRARHRPRRRSRRRTAVLSYQPQNREQTFRLVEFADILSVRFASRGEFAQWADMFTSGDSRGE